jgi:integrase
MKVRKNKDSRTKTPWMVDAFTEHRNGDLPQRFYRKDANGKPFAKQKEAEAYIRELIDNMRTGTNPDDVRSKTFGDALALYRDKLDLRQSLGAGKPVHYDDLRARLITHVEAFTLRDVAICKVRLSTIDIDLVEKDLVLQLRDEKFTVPMQKKLLHDISEVFKCAMVKNWIQINPTKTIEIGKESKQSRNSIEVKARDIYEVLADNWSQYIAWVERFNPAAVLPIQTATKTGMRAGELTCLTPADIGHNSRRISINSAWKRDERNQPKVKGDTKSGKDRVIIASSNLVGQLTRHIGDNNISRDGLVFGTTDQGPWRKAWQAAQFAMAGWLMIYSGSAKKTYRMFELSGAETDEDINRLRSWSDGQVGKPLHSKRADGIVFDTLDEAAKHADIKLLNFHDLRHLYCSLLFRNDESIATITRYMGHSSEKVTRDHYEEWITNDDLGVAVSDRLEASLG